MIIHYNKCGAGLNRRFVVIIFVVLVSFLIAGCTTSRNDVVYYDPPAPKYQQMPLPPGPTFVWILGHWEWEQELDKFVWLPGYWTAGIADKYWIPGYWERYDNGWIWIVGKWKDS